MRTEHLGQHLAVNGTTANSPPGPTEDPAPPTRRWRRLLSLRAAVVVAVTLLVLGVFVAPKVRSWLAAPSPGGLLFASGRIEGRITTLTPKTSAWVVALHVDEGQAVEANQVLATLDDQAQRERLRSAEEQLNALTERLRAADTQLAMTDRQVTLQIEQASAARRGLSDVRIPQIEARPRVEYNPNLVETWFSSLLEVFNQATMIAMLLAAAAMVREREHGTIEHLLVSPLRPIELFAAKLVPVVTLVPLAVVGSVLGIVEGAFQTPIRGSLVLFYIVTAVYVFAMASLGLGIAVLARTLGQAMMMLLLILYPMMLLSGAFTPPESQGAFMRTVGLLSPVRHYVDFGYQVLFKGNGLGYVWHDVAGILALGVALFLLSVRRFAILVR